jgi:hypothetical protein
MDWGKTRKQPRKKCYLNVSHKCMNESVNRSTNYVHLFLFAAQDISLPLTEPQRHYSAPGLKYSQADDHLTPNSYYSNRRPKTVSLMAADPRYERLSHRRHRKHSLPLLRALSLSGKHVHRAVPQQRLLYYRLFIEQLLGNVSTCHSYVSLYSDNFKQYVTTRTTRC